LRGAEVDLDVVGQPVALAATLDDSGTERTRAPPTDLDGELAEHQQPDRAGRLLALVCRHG
jgi:hypothetical protein